MIVMLRVVLVRKGEARNKPVRGVTVLFELVHCLVMMYNDGDAGKKYHHCHLHACIRIREFEVDEDE